MMIIVGLLQRTGFFQFVAIKAAKCSRGNVVFTLIGDPPNVITSSKAGFSFTDFPTHTAPVAWIALLLTLAFLIVRYRASFRQGHAKLPVLIQDERRVLFYFSGVQGFCRYSSPPSRPPWPLRGVAVMKTNTFAIGIGFLWGSRLFAVRNSGELLPLAWDPNRVVPIGGER